MRRLARYLALIIPVMGLVITAFTGCNDNKGTEGVVITVKDPGDNKYSKEDIEAFFSKKVEELYGYPEYKLNFCWMDEIPPDENGKMRCFICKVKK